jgi:hypothetical protein
MLNQARSGIERLQAQFLLEGPPREVLLNALLLTINEVRSNPDGELLRLNMLHNTAGEFDYVFNASSNLWTPFLENMKKFGELRPGLDIYETSRWLNLVTLLFGAFANLIANEELVGLLEAYVCEAILTEAVKTAP